MRYDGLAIDRDFRQAQKHIQIHLSPKLRELKAIQVKTVELT